MIYKISFRSLFLLLMLLVNNNVFAIEHNNEDNKSYKLYCEENQLGWKFYCDRKDPEDSKESKEMEEKISSYSEKLKQLQDNFNEILAKAVLNPTEENIKNYMYAQIVLADRSSLFADRWQRILWNTPSLDYTQKIPVNNLAKTIWKDERSELEQNTIQNINERYGLFFIYSSTCPYCQRYSQILFEIKKEYNLEILGVSVDGNFLPNWEENSVVDTGQLQELKISTDYVPITVLFDNITKKTIIVGSGLMAKDMLLMRIYYLTQTNPGEVF